MTVSWLTEMRKDNYYMQDRLPKEQKNYFLCTVSYFGTSANMKKINWVAQYLFKTVNL